MVPSDLEMAGEKHQISETIRVLVEHDVRLIRDGIESLLDRIKGFTVVRASSVESWRHIQREHNPVDIVLALSELATISALDHIKRIRTNTPGTRIIILGVSGSEKESLEYIEAGASGYVSPDSRLKNLIETIQTVYKGEASCPPAMMARLFERIALLRMQLQIVQNTELGSLTQRELEVLKLVAEGMSNKEIATSLKLELQTVKNHIHNILEKLRVRNRWEAVAYNRRNKITVESNSESTASFST